MTFNITQIVLLNLKNTLRTTTRDEPFHIIWHQSILQLFTRLTPQAHHQKCLIDEYGLQFSSQLETNILLLKTFVRLSNGGSLHSLLLMKNLAKLEPLTQDFHNMIQ